MAVANKYKLIQLELPDPTSQSTKSAISELNSRFSPDDFYVIQDNRRLEIWLRQVDFAYLSVTAQEIGAVFDCVELTRNIIKAVESVRSYGLNSNKRLYVGYNRERKVHGRKSKELRRGKHFYANNNDFANQNSLFPAEFSDRIICGDSEEVLQRLPDNCVDLVFTSPPYNFGLGYQESGNTGDADDWESYFAKLFRVFDQCIRVVKFGGRIVVNVQPLFSDYIPSHHIISSYFMERHMIWKGEILWEKNNYNCKYTAWGSWKSPSSPYLKYTWEFLEVFCKGSLKKSGNPANADIDADSFKEWVVGKWSIAPERRMREFDHPAMFPVELARRALLLFSFRGDTILDPFAGVGTTCVAAQQDGRRFLGIDISSKYCLSAEQRLNGVQLGGMK